MLKPMFPHTVDSTMLSTFRSCPQKLFRTYVEHWKPRTESVHLVAGGAFAKGIEVARKAFFEQEILTPKVTYDDNGNRHVEWLTSHEQVTGAEAAEIGAGACLAAYGDFECPPDSAKSAERTLGALEFYFDRYPLGADGMEPITMPGSGRRGIEFSFAEPLEVKHPISGDPILYTGRADMLAEFNDGIFVVDEKTASQLGASWSRQWEMRGQFTGYQWAAGRAGINAQGSIVRGISILKTKYDTLQAITYRTPYEVQRWYDQTHRDVRRMLQCWEQGWWDFNMDGACTEYGGCSLVDICKSSPDIAESYLPIKFEKRVWDPLARRQLSVEEWEASWGHAG